jgi:hypothetical protein
MPTFMKFVSFAVAVAIAGSLAKSLGWLAFVLGGAVGIGLYAFYSGQRMERESRERAERERIENERHHKLMEEALVRNKAELQQQLRKLSNVSSAATKELAVAARDFDERAFAPFWDSVERVLKILADYDRELRYVKSKADDLDGVAKRLGRPAPSRKELITIPDVVQPATDLRTLVRRAQRDFEFSQIYESRRTNKILIEGFETLANAIDGLGTREGLHNHRTDRA